MKPLIYAFFISALVTLSGCGSMLATFETDTIEEDEGERTMGRVIEDDNIETLLRVCNAIRYAHSRGLIHRDIKPENVMLGQFGEVLLADWGLAISRVASALSSTVALAPVGSSNPSQPVPATPSTR